MEHAFTLKQLGLEEPPSEENRQAFQTWMGAMSRAVHDHLRKIYNQEKNVRVEWDSAQQLVITRTRT